MKLLLDTCALIWMASDSDRVGSRASLAIDNAQEIYLSDVTVWEICLKWQAGKIQLPSPPRLWCESQVAQWRLSSCPIRRSHLYRVSELPLHHRDPFDRLLIGQALEEGMTIVTPDEHIQKYPVGWIW